MIIRAIVNWLALQALGWANPGYKAKVDAYEADRKSQETRIEQETAKQVQLAIEARAQAQVETAAELRADTGQKQLDEILKPKVTERLSDDDEFRRLSSRTGGT